MGNFWSAQNVQIDINHLIVDDNFNMEENTEQLIHDFNILFGNYINHDESIRRVRNGMPIIIRLLGGILYYYKECMYAEDFVEITNDILTVDQITPVKKNMGINEWMDIWDSFLKNLEDIDTHSHLLEYKNLCLFETMLEITIKMYKNVKDITI